MFERQACRPVERPSASYDDCALVYVASTTFYVDEAIASAASARAMCPGLRIYIKVSGADGAKARSSGLFDEVQVIPDPKQAYIDKSCFLRDVEETKVLFLDGDTHVASPIADGFRMLDRYDIVCAHAAKRVTQKVGGILNDISPAFPEANTGVIFSRNDARTQKFMAGWSRIHTVVQDITDDPADQPAFRYMLWTGDLDYGVLPPEYNARTILPLYLQGEVKIVHGRHSMTMSEVAKRLNSRFGPRVFRPREFGEPLARWAGH